MKHPHIVEACRKAFSGFELNDKTEAAKEYERLLRLGDPEVQVLEEATRPQKLLQQIDQTMAKNGKS